MDKQMLTNKISLKSLGLNKNRQNQSKIHYIETEKIVPTKYQPRKEFGDKALLELSQSIRTHGVLQPLIVRQQGEGYLLIAGERRLRAAMLAGLDRVPSIITERDEKSCAEISLIENIQRQNLSFFEEAAALRRLIDEFSLTQAQVAERLGKTQSSIANKLRILKLPAAAQMIISTNNLSERHARELLRLENNNQIFIALDKIIKRRLNVAQTEALIDKMVASKKSDKHMVKAGVRDVRIFVNTINRAVGMIKKAGIKPITTLGERDGFVEYTIKIPKTS
jgi:nucleoid occlusion protein